MSQLAQRLIMAAGGAKKDSTYVDEVFSTYLWDGTGGVRSINNGIKLSNDNAGNSVFFDGSGDNLLVASSSEFTMTGDFTMECWFNPTSVSGVNVILNGRGNAGSGGPVIYINGTTLVFDNGTGTVCSQSSAVAVDTWYHVAGTRSGNTWTLYKNGSSVATGSDSTSYSSSVGFYIGQSHHGNEDYNGYISNVRITKGQVIYSGNFTPSTQALTTTSQGATASNVKLLCCQSSTSATAATKSPTTITANGNVQAQAFGPFTADDGEGGLVWIKARNGGGYGHRLVDTVRGATKAIESYDTTVEATESNGLTSFNNNGFTVGSQSHYNGSGKDMTSWTWRKQKGFFDVVTWTGNNTAGRQLPHNLGSRPGMVAIKCTSHNHNWTVWHRYLSSNAKTITLNDNSVEFTNDAFNGAAPTSSVIHLSSTNASNAAGKTYVAYLWAGGASDEPGAARSVDFDGSADQLNIPDSTDWDLGNGDFTLETWIKSTQTTSGYFTALGQWTTHTSTDYGWAIRYASQDIGTGWSFFYSTNGSNYITTMGSDISDGQWHHVAVCRSGNNLRTFTDGILNTTRSTTDTFNTSGATMKIGGQSSSGNYFDGQLSNVRLVKGTALYTSSFRPPTAGLTDITNTKLLCCNKNTVTGSTVTPGTITTSSSPAVSTDTPFDDPEGFKFGEGGDQNIIKTGGYRGNGNSNGPEVYLGWEPQWVMVKRTSGGTGLWLMADNMRGVVNGGDDPYLQANGPDDEYTSYNWIEFTPTGFKLTNTGVSLNSNGDNYVYIAIRRPDGYVGKPAEVGTDVFFQNMLNASGHPSIRSSNFAGDMGTIKTTAIANSWNLGTRLTQGQGLVTDTSAAEVANSNWQFDYMNGANEYNNASVAFISYLWKRHAGFDVVTYKGNGVSQGQQIPHSLNQVPEMIWLKNRDGGSDDWQVYHIGFNGGTNPHLYRMYLNTNNGENADQWTWDSPPTATHFSVGANGAVNRNNQNLISMLFASVDGISKVGYYIGDGTNNRQITTGFQPRFIVITLANQGGGYGWQTMDSVRGFIGTGGSGNEVLRLDNANAQSSQNTYFTPTATGFTITESAFNGSSQNWIYYAHA